MDRSSLDENFPSNSHKSKKKVEKIVKTKVKVKKPSKTKELSASIIGEDPQSVFSYVITDVVLPALKNMFADAVSNGVEMLLFGESKSDRTKRGGSYVSYNSMYGNNSQNRRNTVARRKTCEDIVFESRSEAEEVLDALTDIVNEYESASIADLYDLVGVTTDFTDNKFGWYALGGASIRRVRDGYILDLPKAKELR